MEKEFVPHEYALELKEIGFNGHSFGYYHNLGSNQLLLSKKDLREDSNDSIQYFLAPTFSQAFRWFRSKSLNGDIVSQQLPRNNFSYGFKVGGSDIFHDGFETYEEAELACLKKLIELAKTKN